MPLTGAHKFEKLFRKSAGLDVDRADIAVIRISSTASFYDLLLMA
jgi:hypothetical protein